MNKYDKYFDYIIDDIEKPYFKNMKLMYSLSDKESEFLLRRLYGENITVGGKSIYDTNGNVLYFEDNRGSWVKQVYDVNGNVIYYENSSGYWVKKEFDQNGNRIYYEDSSGKRYRQEFDQNGNEIY